jgi:heme/copper-type cytochrome/quinol oxidase subunit 1
MSGQLARRVDAAAFGLAMLGLCWWLHAALTVLAWLVRGQSEAPLPLLAVEVFAAELVALGLPVLAGAPVFRLVQAALSALDCVALLLPRLAARLLPRVRTLVVRRPASRGVR